MKSFRFLFFFLLSANHLPAQNAWSLQKCIEQGYTHSQQVMQNKLQEEINLLQIKQSKNAFYPTVNLSINPGLSFGRTPVSINYTYTNQTVTNTNANIGSNIVLFNGNSRTLAVNAAIMDWKSTLLENDQLKYDISLSILGYYLQAALSKEQVKNAQLQLDKTALQQNNTRTLVRAGLQPEVNLAELDVQFAKDSLNKIIAEENFILSTLSLKNYLSISPDSMFDVEYPDTSLLSYTAFSKLSWFQIYENAITGHPQFALTKNKYDKELTNIKIAKSSRLPTISFDFGISSAYSQVLSKNTFFKDAFFNQIDNNFRQYLSLSVLYPIFDGNKVKNNIKRSQITLRTIQVSSYFDSLKLKQEIYKAFTDLSLSQKKYAVAKIGVTAAEKSLEISEKKYSLGILNSIDLLTNQNNLYKTKQDLLLSKYEYIFKLKILEFYNNKPINP